MQVDASLGREWEELAERTGAAPFMRPGWIGAWADAFAGGRLQALTLRRSGELAALLAVRPGLRGLRSPVNWHTPVFGPVAGDGDALDELLRGAFDRKPVHAGLSFVDSRDPAADAFRSAARRAGYRLVTRPRLTSPFLRLEVGTDPVQALSAKRRSNLRRLSRRLEELGRLELDVQPQDDSLEEAFALEASGWKQDRGTAITASAGTLRFYRSVARWAAARGQLRLLHLRLDGRAIASDIALEDDRSHYLLKTGYSVDLRRYAPGVALRMRAIARAAELGLETYEFLGDAEPTKLEWTSSCRDRIELTAFRPSPAGSAALLAHTRGRRLVQRGLARVGRR